MHYTTWKLINKFNREIGRNVIAIIPSVVIEILELPPASKAGEDISPNTDRVVDARNVFDVEGRRYLTVEPFIDGAMERFSKFNSNAFNWRLLISDRHADPVSDAFSHFSHHVTQGELLVCDIQGVRGAAPRSFGRYAATIEDAPTLLTMTDPQIITKNDSRDFGAGNGCSEDHIRAWFASHQCRGPCRALGLAHPFPRDLESGLVRVLRYLSWSPFFFRGDYYYDNDSLARSSSIRKTFHISSGSKSA